MPYNSRRNGRGRPAFHLPMTEERSGGYQTPRLCFPFWRCGEHNNEVHRLSNRCYGAMVGIEDCCGANDHLDIVAKVSIDGAVVRKNPSTLFEVVRIHALRLDRPAIDTFELPLLTHQVCATLPRRLKGRPIVWPSQELILLSPQGLLYLVERLSSNSASGMRLITAC